MFYGEGSGDENSVNETSFIILFISSCVFGIVETMKLLLGVCRLYSGGYVSKCEVEW